MCITYLSVRSSSTSGGGGGWGVGNHYFSQSQVSFIKVHIIWCKIQVILNPFIQPFSKKERNPHLNYLEKLNLSAI